MNQIRKKEGSSKVVLYKVCIPLQIFHMLICKSVPVVVFGWRGRAAGSSPGEVQDRQWSAKSLGCPGKVVG